MAKEGIVEKENILKILSASRKAIAEKDILSLKELSNQTVHSASVYQDPDSVAIAVLVYALSKIFERSKYETYKDWPSFNNAITNGIDNAIGCLKKDDIECFREQLHGIRTAVNRLSGHLKIYIEDVFRKAMINKASRLYEHGISMEQTSSLLGITPFELAEYAGKTGIGDVDLSITLDIKTRIKDALGFFER